MGSTPVILLLAVGLSTAIAGITNESSSTLISNITKDLENPTNVTSRSGRHLQIIEIPSLGRKTKRQIIRIPADVSKVKLVRPTINIKTNRTPPQFNRQPPYYRSGGSRRPNNKKTQIEDYDIDESHFDDEKKVKRTLKKFRVKEISPQELFADEEIDFGQKKPKIEQPVLKPKRKNVLNDYLANYEVDNKKERQKEEGVFENRYKGIEAINNYDSAASSIHLKQVPAPNLFPMKVIGAPELAKQSYHVEKPILGKYHDENYIPGFSVKKLPTKGRQIQSIFSQQYTTHNPHVATNFGLNGFGGVNGVQYIPKTTYMETTYAFPTGYGKFTQPSVAASDQIVTTLPVITPGIQVIQPPQFRDVTVSHPSQPSRLISSSPQQDETSTQRATIRDILEQDCPFHDTKGYCESPPRYPMQQIGNIIKKCSSFMEIMNTQPFDEPHDVYRIGKRADNVESETTNSTDTENHSSWARSSSEESTACASDLTLTEPGYAKEVISGRWFVIVQHPETTIQRIATDTCKNPGKPCGGLAGIKCNKLPNKSTRCIQRYTYQRLISWDPESPDGCPRIRLFRFPSACVCHLGI